MKLTINTTCLFNVSMMVCAISILCMILEEQYGGWVFITVSVIAIISCIISGLCAAAIDWDKWKADGKDQFFDIKL